MTVPLSPGQQGDDEEISESLEARQELQSGEQVTVDEEISGEAQLPPEAQGETNGGPLGCCLGVTVGLLLSLTVAKIGKHLYREYELSPRQQQRLAHLEQRQLQRQARRH